MFERFTEKAINAVSEAKEQSIFLHNALVQPEHLLLGIAKEAKGISLKILKDNNITFEKLQQVVDERLRFEKTVKRLQPPVFSDEFKNILKISLDIANKSGHKYILFEHLFLAVINDKNSYVARILDGFNFNIEKSTELLQRLVQKKIKIYNHPEQEDVQREELNDYLTAESFFDGTKAKQVFERAVAKLSASNYEILGTEQILASILEDKSSTLALLLEKQGITEESYNEKLSIIQSRQAEFENKSTIFTPNAFIAMNEALEIAKELGSSEIKPEHMVLGLLKSKKGIAYNILKELNVSVDALKSEIMQPIERQRQETLMILKLAKEEARRLGRTTVGTEMFLLGIISEATGVGARVLNELEITLKDARTVIENIIGYGNEYFDNEITFTPRAKKVLQSAWKLAKLNNQPRIESSHLLYALTTESTCVAMQALEQLGVDAIEIKQGILKETGKNSD